MEGWRLACYGRSARSIGSFPNGRKRRVLVIPESQAERRLTPAMRLLAGESGIVRQQVPGTLALLIQRSRPCSGRYLHP